MAARFHLFGLDNGTVVLQEMQAEGNGALITWRAETQTWTLRINVLESGRVNASRRFLHPGERRLAFRARVCNRFKRSGLAAEALVRDAKCSVFWQCVFLYWVKPGVANAGEYLHDLLFRVVSVDVESKESAEKQSYLPKVHAFAHRGLSVDIVLIEQASFILRDMLCVTWKTSVAGKLKHWFIVVKPTPRAEVKPTPRAVRFVRALQQASVHRNNVQYLYGSEEAILFWQDVFHMLVSDEGGHNSVKRFLEASLHVKVFTQDEKDCAALFRRHPEVQLEDEEMVRAACIECRCCGLVFPWCAFTCDECGNVCKQCSPADEWAKCSFCEASICSLCDEERPLVHCVCCDQLACQKCLDEDNALGLVHAAKRKYRKLCIDKSMEHFNEAIVSLFCPTCHDEYEAEVEIDESPETSDSSDDDDEDAPSAASCTAVATKKRKLVMVA